MLEQLFTTETNAPHQVTMGTNRAGSLRHAPDSLKQRDLISRGMNEYVNDVFKE